MNFVWIVLSNGKVDEVFDNPEAAKAHYRALIKKWSLAQIVEKEVKTL